MMLQGKTRSFLEKLVEVAHDEYKRGSLALTMDMDENELQERAEMLGEQLERMDSETLQCLKLLAKSHLDLAGMIYTYLGHNDTAPEAQATGDPRAEEIVNTSQLP